MLIYGVPGKGIYRLGIETLEPELIPLVEEENFSFQLLAWSDDSRYILFESAQGEQAGVYLVDSVNLNIRSIDFGFQPNVEVTDYACQWAPNLDIFACVVGFSKIENKVLIGDVNGKLVKVFDLPELVEGQTNDLSWWPMVALYPEWKYKITRTGANLNVRDTYSTSAKSLTKLAQGAIFTTLEGPIAAEGYNWWRIRTEDGIEGWIVDVPGWYLLEGTP